MDKENSKPDSKTSVELNTKLNSNTAGLAFSVNVVVFVLVSLLLSIIITAAALPEESDGYVYLSYLVAPVALFIGCFATLKYKKQRLREVAPVKCHVKYYAIAILLIFGLLFALVKLNTYTLELLKLIGYTPKDGYLPSLEGGLIVPALIVIAVLPALFEEFLFRGIILNNARQSVGDIYTIFIVGFCFSIFHGSPEQTVYQFLSGCAFAFLALRSGSILPSLLMHFLNNATIIILNACGATDANGNILISQTGDIILTIAAALALVGSIVWLILDKKPIKKCEAGGVKAFFINASVGIVILAVIWVLSFVGV